jgi:hypothetical protein
VSMKGVVPFTSSFAFVMLLLVVWLALGSVQAVASVRSRSIQVRASELARSRRRACMFARIEVFCRLMTPAAPTPRSAIDIMTSTAV